MPRPPRIEFPGAIYHVMSRGVAKLMTFCNDKERKFFLRIMGAIVREGKLIIHAYCLMPNHFHLLAQTPSGELGRWMQELLGRYAQRFNYSHKRVGHLWQGRYKAILVEAGQYFLECSRYIHLNPIRAQLTPPAELYLWSSYRNYLNETCAVEWVHTKRIMSYFNDIEAYRDFVDSGMKEKLVNPFDRASASLALGSEDFIERVRLQLKSDSISTPLTLRRLGRAKTPPPVDEIRAAVENIFADWSNCQKTRILMFALRSYTWSKVRDIAHIVGKTESAVSQAVKAVRIRAHDNPLLAKRLADLGEQLGGLITDRDNSPPPLL